MTAFNSHGAKANALRAIESKTTRLRQSWREQMDRGAVAEAIVTRAALDNAYSEWAALRMAKVLPGGEG